jgi:hypothetical protein
LLVLSISEALRLVPDDFRSMGKLWSCYSLVYLPLAASAANAKATITTQDDSYLLVMSMEAYATDTSATPLELTAPQATLTLLLASNFLMPDNNPLHLATLNTNATKVGDEDLEFPLWIPPATTLTGLLTNLTPTAMNVRIAFKGIRFLTSVKGTGL